MSYQIGHKDVVNENDKDIKSQFWFNFARDELELINKINAGEFDPKQYWIRKIDIESYKKTVSTIYLRVYRFYEHIRQNKDRNPVAALKIALNLANEINNSLEEIGIPYNEALVSLETEDSLILNDLMLKASFILDKIKNDIEV